MFRNREGKLPPPKFFAEALASLSIAYPDAVLAPELLKQIEQHLIREWQNGQSGPDAAKATCSCDGTTITMSPAVVSPTGEVREPLPKGAARPPKGAKRDGTIPNVESVREAKSLTDARTRHGAAIAAVEAKTSVLARLNAKTASGSRSSEDKTRLEVAASELERAITELTQAEKELQEAQQSAPWVNRHIPVPTLPNPEAPSQVQQQLTAKAKAKTKAKPRSRVRGPNADPNQLLLGLEAIPDPSAEGYSARLLLRPSYVPVASIKEATQTLLTFIVEHNLTRGNMGGVAGRLSTLKDGPVGQIDFSGKVTILRPDLISSDLTDDDHRIESSGSVPYSQQPHSQPQEKLEEPDEDVVAALLDDFAAARARDGGR